MCVPVCALCSIHVRIFICMLFAMKYKIYHVTIEPKRDVCAVRVCVGYKRKEKRNFPLKATKYKSNYVVSSLSMWSPWCCSFNCTIHLFSFLLYIHLHAHTLFILCSLFSSSSLSLWFTGSFSFPWYYPFVQRISIIYTPIYTHTLTHRHLLLVISLKLTFIFIKINHFMLLRLFLLKFEVEHFCCANTLFTAPLIFISFLFNIYVLSIPRFS